jgi:hypothetical protein
MKGISLIQDTFLLICTIAIVVIMTIFVWVLILTFQVEDRLLPGGVPTTRSVEMSMFVKPATYESMMSAFLESEYNGVKVKEIMNAVAIQRSKTVWLRGDIIDSEEVAHDYMDNRIGRYFILKVDDIVIAERGTLTSSNNPMSFQKVSIRMFMLDGTESFLQLLIAG